MKLNEITANLNFVAIMAAFASIIIFAEGDWRYMAWILVFASPHSR